MTKPYQCVVVAVHGVHAAPALEWLLELVGLMHGPDHGVVHLVASAFTLATLAHHIAHKERENEKVKDQDESGENR